LRFSKKERQVWLSPAKTAMHVLLLVSAGQGVSVRVMFHDAGHCVW
jgi:hypothetical protein